MSLPNSVMYRVEPNTKLALVIPGRRIPEKMTLWLDFTGVMKLLQPLLMGAIHMPKSSEAVWGLEFEVLKMQQGHEPVMHAPDGDAREMVPLDVAPEGVPEEAAGEPEGPAVGDDIEGTPV